jgi:hypothetical protein
MPWYDAFRRSSPALTAAGVPQLPPAETLTAAASPPRGPAAQFLRHTDKWQNEVWGYYDNLGEFNFGVGWQASMLSRVRLRAARLQPDVDEPEIMIDGPAAELMMNFGGGVTGQAQLMKRLTVQLQVPGECYLIGEEQNKTEQWMVRSVDEIRSQSGTYYVIDENSVNAGQDWRRIAANSLVTRVWRPHDRFYHLADSPARSAREIMRELELVNRKIQAEYLSRLASAGLLGIPDELTFPVREEFADAPNPLVAEFIEIAATAIEKPGTASSVIPIPIMGPAEAIKELRHIDFTLKMDEKIIEKRDSAIKRLATKLDMPAEILLGMGDVNHWGAWQLEEGALKTHIAPVAELICDSLTRGYLKPRLEASGEDPSGWVVWYDMSELALRPDRSENAVQAYDRLELSGDAFRRELGFDEDDRPEGDDLQEQTLKSLIRNVPQAAPSAVNVLLGSDVLDVAATSISGASDEKNDDAAKQAAEAPPAAPGTGKQAPKAAPPAGPPGSGGAKESTPPAKAAAQARYLEQGRTQHMVRFPNVGQEWELIHPQLCHDHEYSCPYTHAVSRRAPDQRPGVPGTYLVHLDTFGLLRIDGRAPFADTRSLISTQLRPGGLDRMEALRG